MKLIEEPQRPEKSKEEAFGRKTSDVPADIRPRTFGQALQILENRHHGTDMPYGCPQKTSVGKRQNLRKFSPIFVLQLPGKWAQEISRTNSTSCETKFFHSETLGAGRHNNGEEGGVYFVKQVPSHLSKYRFNPETVHLLGP